jgi:hypothetical protein
MVKNRSMIPLLLATLALPSSTGCGRKVTCKNLAQKNQKCAEAFESYIHSWMKKRAKRISANLSAEEKSAFEETLPQEIKQASKLFLTAMTEKPFLEECKKNWGADSAADQKTKEQIKACFAKKNCQEYVHCLMAKILQGKGRTLMNEAAKEAGRKTKS